MINVCFVFLYLFPYLTINANSLASYFNIKNWIRL